MKTKNIVFRVDPGTYRQIQAEATRRGLSVSGYVRLMATAPLVETSPPDARPLTQELKNLIAEAHEVQPGDVRAQVDLFKRSVEAVIAAHGVVTDTVRWLVNLGQVLDDLDLATVMPMDTFIHAAKAMMTVKGQIEEAARQLVAIGQTIDLPTKPHRRGPDASPGHAGGDDPPDAD